MLIVYFVYFILFLILMMFYMLSVLFVNVVFMFFVELWVFFLVFYYLFDEGVNIGLFSMIILSFLSFLIMVFIVMSNFCFVFDLLFLLVMFKYIISGIFVNVLIFYYFYMNFKVFSNKKVVLFYYMFLSKFLILFFGMLGFVKGVNDYWFLLLLNSLVYFFVFFGMLMIIVFSIIFIFLENYEGLVMNIMSYSQVILVISVVFGFEMFLFCFVFDFMSLVLLFLYYYFNFGGFLSLYGDVFQCLIFYLFVSGVVMGISPFVSFYLEVNFVAFLLLVGGGLFFNYIYMFIWFVLISFKFMGILSLFISSLIKSVSFYSVLEGNYILILVLMFSFFVSSFFISFYIFS